MNRGTNCRYCGREVEWLVSKAGKKYLAETAPIYNEDGRQIKTIYPAHRCQVTPEQRAAIESGERVKGQTVVVAKGRKFPIGTEGTITWIASHEDGFGVIKVRVQKNDGEQFYINIKNLAVKEGK